MRQEYSRERHSTTHFLTYADNNAVGYFVKQGFSKEIMLERERWFGYIKDCDGGTMMECPLSNAISYTKFPEMIRKQRQAVDEKLKQYSTSHIVRAALTHVGCCAVFKAGRRERRAGRRVDGDFEMVFIGAVMYVHRQGAKESLRRDVLA